MSGIKLVTLPIGNKDDITIRAKNIIIETKNIYCEDTRVFKDLCKRIEVDYSTKQIRSYHDHSSDKSLETILNIAMNEDCIFVSDAGSPLISDPAYPLIEKAILSDIEIDSIGGISAVTTALELSGLPPTPFHFHGFLARDKGKILSFASEIKTQYGTHIFFEGVSRVIKTLEILTEEMPQYKFAIGRELTKDYQSVHRFIGSEFSEIKKDIIEKGEFVILINNPEKTESISGDVKNLVEEILSKGAKPKLISKLISELSGLNAKEVYEKISR